MAAVARQRRGARKSRKHAAHLRTLFLERLERSRLTFSAVYFHPRFPCARLFLRITSTYTAPLLSFAVSRERKRFLAPTLENRTACVHENHTDFLFCHHPRPVSSSRVCACARVFVFVPSCSPAIGTGTRFPSVAVIWERRASSRNACNCGRANLRRWKKRRWRMIGPYSVIGSSSLMQS